MNYHQPKLVLVVSRNFLTNRTFWNWKVEKWRLKKKFFWTFFVVLNDKRQGIRVTKRFLAETAIVFDEWNRKFVSKMLRIEHDVPFYVISGKNEFWKKLKSHESFVGYKKTFDFWIRNILSSLGFKPFLSMIHVIIEFEKFFNPLRCSECENFLTREKI